MVNFYFDTDGFRDTEKRLKENINEIGGFELCEVLQLALSQAGFQTDEIFPEDYGWAFDANLAEAKYFCSASIDPDDDGNESKFSHFGNLNIEIRRSFLDKLTGRNKLEPDDPAIEAIKLALENHIDVHDLKSSLN